MEGLENGLQCGVPDLGHQTPPTSGKLGEGFNGETHAENPSYQESYGALSTLQIT